MYTILFRSDHGLDLYKVLAPNAYPQLDGHVQVTDGRVLSQVYDVSWVSLKHSVILDDDNASSLLSATYLHVDYFTL